VKVVGVSISPHQLNETFRVENQYEYEIWSDGAKGLSLHYGAASSPGAFFANRISVLLDANGYWILTYDPVSDPGGHPSDVLSDCEAVFGP